MASLGGNGLKYGIKTKLTCPVVFSIPMRCFDDVPLFEPENPVNCCIGIGRSQVKRLLDIFSSQDITRY